MSPRGAAIDGAVCPLCASAQVERTRFGDVGLSRRCVDCGAAFDATGSRIAFAGEGGL